MLSVWSNGREQELKQVAQQLLEESTSRAYLSPNEHTLFSLALRHGPKTWSRFINGEIPCRVRIIEQTEQEQEPTTSLLEIDSLKLAFQVRFMLYDAALPGLYGRPVPEIENSGMGMGAGAPTKTEDDDYDDEVEEEPEVIPEVLDVEAVEEDDTRAQARTMYNYYRMFHTLEWDLDTVLKYKKLQENDREVDLESAPKSLEKISPSVQFGAANLSLKHLLGVIDAKRDEMALTDLELRNLISEVRKNRSKWASEDRIGQEELYETCEKVVLELRATTEHSTAFLNKVSKRDAPNYHQIIKYPMDLNTVMKKLKGLQYNSKKEFVDDLMAIWANCLTYNSDPKHFLRSHAIAMRKKTFALIPLIPDISIRSRQEVEAEAQAETQAEEPEGRGKGLKGQKRRTAEDPKATQVKMEPDDYTEVKIEPDDSILTQLEAEQPAAEDETTQRAATPSTPRETASATPGATPRESRTTPAVGTPDETNPNDTLKDTPMEEEEEVEINHANIDDDWESNVWRKNLTKKRSDYLYLRNSLFRNNRIQANAPVLIRSPANMGKFVELEHNFFTPEKIQRIEDYPLFEYEITATIPGEPACSLTEKLPSMQDLPATKLLAVGELNEIYNRNLNEIQKVRRLCSKINTIKEMQQNPTSFVPAVGPKFPDITDPEPDVSSRLPGAEPMYKPAINATLRRSAAKIAMSSGFEACQKTAINALTDIAGDYLYKTARLLHDNLENPEMDSSPEEIIVGTLKNMGVPKTATLGRYITEDVIRYNKRLLELKTSVTQVLTSLLRPAGLDRYKDEEFKDNSEQFTLGQFSSDLGDDYFGFKELGIDKELGIENVNIPFHLLQQKLAPESDTDAAQHRSKYLQPLPEYTRVSAEALPHIIGVLRPFFSQRFEDKRLVEDGELIEDEKLTMKPKFVRPRVPVTGKIPAKRKPKSLLFIKPKISSSALEISTFETKSEPPSNSEAIDHVLDAFESFGDAI